jgi:hypothetical protein
VKTLLLAVILTILTVILHSMVTYVTIVTCRDWHRKSASPPWLHITGMMGGLVIVLLGLHFAEAAIWAAAMLWWDAMPDYSTALYYSLTSYSTVGYGDVLLPDSARLLGPIESVLGVMMMGWSTAVIVAVVQREFREPPYGALTSESQEPADRRGH